MSDIWSLYKKPTEKLGAPLELRGIGQPRYYTNNETFNQVDPRSLSFYARLAACYGVGLWSYIYCTRHGMRAQRYLSTAVLTAVPLVVLLTRKGVDTPFSPYRRPSLEERLEFYPITRRALERAIADVSK